MMLFARQMRFSYHCLVVDKKYVPERILEAEKQKPLLVMPDDPLFQEDK